MRSFYLSGLLAIATLLGACSTLGIKPADSKAIVIQTAGFYAGIIAPAMGTYLHLDVCTPGGINKACHELSAEAPLQAAHRSATMTLEFALESVKSTSVLDPTAAAAMACSAAATVRSALMALGRTVPIIPSCSS